MISVLIVLLFALLCLLVLVRAARGRAARIENVEDLPLHTRPIDVTAFRNLISARDERFLRDNLSRREYRRVQRLRLRAAVDYVRRAVDNAAVLLRLGEAARRNPNPEVAQAAQELIAQAVMVRLLGYAVLVELWSRMLVPGSGLSVMGLISRYEGAAERVALLGRLQAPAAVSRISTAL